MTKTHFNDEREYPAHYKTSCPDCRCIVKLEVDFYPHGPNAPSVCPICQSSWINVERISND